MTNEKAELKLAVAHSIGCDIEDDLESTNRDMLRASGQLQAAFSLETKINVVIEELDADMKSASPPFKDQDSLDNAKRYLSRTMAACSSEVKQSSDLRLQLEGKIQAFSQMIQRIKHICDAERRKINAVKEVVEKGEKVASSPRSRSVGRHPGPSLADRRRAESFREE